MTALVATDLDRTLIYSRAAAGASAGDLICVEHRDGAPLSFMSRAAASQYECLTMRVPVVPVTTRTPEQYGRIRLPGEPRRFAVVANGAILLVDGAVDPAWSRRTERLMGRAAPLAGVRTRLLDAVSPDLARAVRSVGEFFCYAVVDKRRLPHDLVPELAAWAGDQGWRVSLQGRKLYCVPTQLRKADPVLEIARRVGAESLLAAGDALLDVDLLLAADRAIRPAHGELHELGWSAPHVLTTIACGAAAGEEIVAWLAARCADAPSAITVRGR